MNKGEKYNKLTAIRFVEKRNRKECWLWRCECGKEKVIRVTNVKSGGTKSCGCLYMQLIKTKGQNNKTHGMTKSVTYKSWSCMFVRCYNKNSSDYKHYGERGIKVCQEWKTFDGFYSDMGDRPKGKSLDRIDNNKGYCPENCRWATRKEQNNNKRNNHLLTYNGKTKTIAEWAEDRNIKYDTIWARIKYGWNTERALNL